MKKTFFRLVKGPRSIATRRLIKEVRFMKKTPFHRQYMRMGEKGLGS